MHQISSEDIIHWSSVNREFKSYYVFKEKIYELKINLPLTIDNEGDALDWIIKCQSKGYSEEIGLDNLLSIRDNIMINTSRFKDRISSLVQKSRDKKINSIIYGE